MRAAWKIRAASSIPYGVKVIVDKKSYRYLVGTQLDFSDGLNGKGFTFDNPNAKKACGCGTSFSV